MGSRAEKLAEKVLYAVERKRIDWSQVVEAKNALAELVALVPSPDVVVIPRADAETIRRALLIDSVEVYEIPAQVVGDWGAKPIPDAVRGPIRRVPRFPVAKKALAILDACLNPDTDRSE
jgi:hypothetical protein